ncbi:MAG: HAD family phosphatase [Gammaproteobacteria bacterium]|jgi:HAD superfamily hydrolase (TIGR01509 family)|nr:HAD family phosphatase [Gammaproteobacteria bacterium]MDG1125229.1 HAD family phosphatase [Pseudomonadales bacterium]MBT3695290.1 HAD family phosphatase [Gammaproteobacteria bacterium]MBT5332364.1 HAD family phosphatase [Gammaproteobacteria bacterium]MBT5680724.1 HAD family phosphatase [Gammaproteobacteria bacterium]
MQKYSHLLFDHDGVLVNTEHLYYESTRRKLSELDIDLTLPIYMQIMVNGSDVWELARVRGLPEEVIASQRLQRNVLYQTLLGAEDLSIEGVEEVLVKLKQKYSMAIVTTCKDADFAYIHDHSPNNLNIVPHMDLVLTRSSYTNSKPDPEPYLTALERFSITPDQALVIEDSERGLRSAVAAGIDCAVVEYAFTASQDFSKATYRIKNLSDLVILLRGRE